MRRKRFTSSKRSGLPRTHQLKSGTVVTVDGHHNSPASIAILHRIFLVVPE
jgi:hypothetical protein